MTKLARTLTLADLLYLTVGSVIGSGIFIVPAAVLRQSDLSLGVALLVWVVAGLLSVMGALTYGEMGAMNPEAGGLYVYLRDAFGSFTAFLYGWTLFFVLSSGSIAALGVAFTRYLGQLVPLSPGVALFVPVVLIVVLGTVNALGTRRGATVQSIATLIKVGAIVLMSLVLLSLGSGYGEAMTTFWPREVTGTLVSQAGLAMVSALWAYEGWQYTSFCAGETIDPERNFHRGIIYGTVIVMGVYLLANIAYVAALGPVASAASPRIAADAVSALVGPTAAKLITVAILVSMLGAINGIILAAPRVYYAMARDRVFFAQLANVHPRFGTPAVAIVACTCWAAILTLSGTFEQLLNYVVTIGWIFYGLGGAAIFYYRRVHPDAVRPFRAPGYPVSAILFVLSAAAIVLNALATQPRDTLIGIGVVALGTPAFLWWRRRAGA